MKESLTKGLSQVRKVTVDTARTIGFMGEDCRVYATPDLIRDIESTCRDLMLEHADPGEDSVGSKVSIAHSAPTLCGMDVEITVTVAEIDRNKVVFDVSAADPVDVICTGQHERFVVDVERTRQRLRAKAAKAAEAA
jgi:fluoroacetyl-CoA thioesterase